jgi:hypothetical protein
MNKLAAMALLLGACAGGQTSTDSAAPESQDDAGETASEPAVAESSSDHPAEPTGPSKVLSVNVSMQIDGNLDAKALVAKVNDQLSHMDPCVKLIRVDDEVVRSLNLHVEVKSGGAMAVELQSPVNASAKRCLLDGMRQWQTDGVGSGRAMVLLELKDLE